MDWIRRRRPAPFILGSGTLLAIALFAATSARAPNAPADFDFQNALGRPGGEHLSPYAEGLKLSGFDPWTGRPHGWTYWDNAMAWRPGAAPTITGRSRRTSLGDAPSRFRWAS